MIAPALLLLLAGGAEAPVVLARVDDAVITSKDVAERRRALGARAASVPTSDLVTDLVNDALLAVDARRRGIDREPAVAAEFEAQRRRVYADVLLGRFADAAKPSEAQLREMYHSTSDVVRLKLVKVATRQDAEAALARIEAGGDIESEAARSLDPALAVRRGDTGLVVRAALPPPIAAEAFKVDTGTIIGPVELQLGWAIAELVERRIADEAGFAARRESIAAFAREQAMTQAKRHLLDRLGDRAKIQLDDAFLASLQGRSELTAAELDHVIATVNGRPLRYRTIQPTVARLFSSVSGHGAKRAVAGIAQAEIESQLLNDEALARGVDRDPAVTSVLPSIERNVLAAALVERLSPQDRQGAAVRKLLDALRAKARVVIDVKKVAEAVR